MIFWGRVLLLRDKFLGLSSFPRFQFACCVTENGPILQKQTSVVHPPLYFSVLRSCCSVFVAPSFEPASSGGALFHPLASAVFFFFSFFAIFFFTFILIFETTLQSHLLVGSSSALCAVRRCANVVTQSTWRCAVALDGSLLRIRACSIQYPLTVMH